MCNVHCDGHSLKTGSRSAQSGSQLTTRNEEIPKSIGNTWQGRVTDNNSFSWCSEDTLSRYDSPRPRGGLARPAPRWLYFSSGRCKQAARYLISIPLEFTVGQTTPTPRGIFSPLLNSPPLLRQPAPSLSLWTRREKLSPKLPALVSRR